MAANRIIIFFQVNRHLTVRRPEGAVDLDQNGLGFQEITVQ